MTGPESRLEAREALSIPEKVWLHHSLIRHEIGNMHPCTAPHRMRNMEGKWVEAGKSLYDNQCAIRMGDALRRAGIKIPKDILNGTLTCGAHPAEEMHTLRAPELARALAVMSQTNSLPGFKKVKKLVGAEVSNFFSKIPATPGIIFINGYYRSPGEQGLNGSHIDMYNGYRTTAKPLSQTFNVVGSLPNYQHAREVWFWEVEDSLLQDRIRRRAEIDERIPRRNAIAGITALAGAMSLSLRAHLGRTIGGTFDDAEGADNRTLVISRRGMFGVAGIVGAMAPFLSTPSLAQQRGRERKAVGTEQPRESVYLPKIKEYERVVQGSSALKTGSDADVQRLLFSRPEIFPYELLPDAEKKLLHPKVHRGYLSPERERELGLMSFPIVPSKITPSAIVDAKKGLPNLSEVRSDALMPLFDGSTWYSNGVRVSDRKRLLEGMYAFAVRGRSESIAGEIKQGQQTFSIDRELTPPYSQAGILGFDEDISRSAHGTWTNALWLKNPDISEGNGSTESKSLEWDAQMGGGYLFDVAQNPSLHRYVESVVREYTSKEGSTHAFQKELVLATLPRSRILILSSSDIHYYEYAMQTVSGAAIVKNNSEGKPVLIGQALWRVHLPKPGGGFQVALIVSDTEQTKKALSSTI